MRLPLDVPRYSRVADVDVRRERLDVVEAAQARLAQFAADGGDRDRHVLNGFLPLARGDDYFLDDACRSRLLRHCAGSNRGREGQRQHQQSCFPHADAMGLPYMSIHTMSPL